MIKKVCSHCKSREKVYKYKGGDYFCLRHLNQLYRLGFIKNRTTRDKNEIICKNGVCKMFLYDLNGNRVYSVIFSNKHVNRIKLLKWTRTACGYAYNHKLKIMLHRYILNAPLDKITDHINRDPKDNRDENLRLCNTYQNCVNKGIQSNNSSGIPGVSFDKNTQSWKIRINFNRKSYWLGRNKDLKIAIKIRNEAMNNIFKEFKPNLYVR